MVEQRQIRKTFGKLFLMAVAVFFGSASLEGAGLDSFCGFKAGEVRKVGIVGDMNRIDVRPMVRFRRFNKVWLEYSDSRRLTEVQAFANVRGMKAAAVKEEFEECIKWFQKAGISRQQGVLGREWSDDNGGDWYGIGPVRPNESRLDANVIVSAYYRDPKMCIGNTSGLPTGWLLDVTVSWCGVDDKDLMPDAPPRRHPPPHEPFLQTTEEPKNASFYTGRIPTNADWRVSEKFPIHVRGDEAFIKRTEEALCLIKDKAPKSYSMLTNNYFIIQRGRQSGIAVNAIPPRFFVGDRTFNSNLRWYASCIIHDAYHLKLYKDYCKKYGEEAPSTVYAGRGPENACLSAQQDFYREIELHPIARSMWIKKLERLKSVEYYTRRHQKEHGPW